MHSRRYQRSSCWEFFLVCRSQMLQDTAKVLLCESIMQASSTTWALPRGQLFRGAVAPGCKDLSRENLPDSNNREVVF